jgi:two-component system, chemotaxis family, protein-glutamate methylesterase/glutaminase
MSTRPERRRRVLVCEDSKTYAACLTRLLERDPELEVVEVCESAEQAIARLPVIHPDLVTMDLELPGMSGAAAIEQIMSIQPVPILVLSGQVERNSHAALAALAAGALDVMPKSDLDIRDSDGPAALALRRRVKVLCRITVIRHPRASLAHRFEVPASWVRTAAVIGIAASTGGPPALAALLAELPSTFPIPILVVQHMSPGFTDGFANWLDGEVPLPVQLAVDGCRPESGVWVAPEGAHLLLTAVGRIALDDSTVDGLHRPSGDVLLRSLASGPGPDAVAIVLTGMGRDGAAGLAEVRHAGGLTIAQDEATSAVYGMPRVAAESGAELVLPLAEIAGRLRALRPLRRAA